MHKRSTRGFGVFETLLAKKRAKKAEKLIGWNRDGRILDIGCGAFPHFLTKTTFAEKYGIDLALHKDSMTQKNIVLKNVNIEKDKLPFPNDFFDVIAMLAVFEHISPNVLEIFLHDVYKKLKKSGRLVITTPAPWSKYPLWFLSRTHLVSRTEIEDHKTSYSQDIILKMLQGTGFSKGNIQRGYFELLLNMWFVAKK